MKCPICGYEMTFEQLLDGQCPGCNSNHADILTKQLADMEVYAQKDKNVAAMLQTFKHAADNFGLLQQKTKDGAEKVH